MSSMAMIDYDYMNKKIEENSEKTSFDYRTECNKLLEKIKDIQREKENELKAKDNLYNQIIDYKDKEIKWLKDLISGILDIQRGKYGKI